MEDKRLVVAKLEELLRVTRQFNDLTLMKYEVAENGMEYVLVYFNNEEKPSYRVNVTADSGVALIRDVLRRIG